MQHKLSVGAILMVLFLSMAPVSRAQTPDPSKKAKAQKLFAEAEKQYYLGRFSKALELYSKAYELAPLPGFLFNIGQCHRMMGNYDKAVFFYRGYLRATDAANRAVVEKLISECRAKAQKQRSATPSSTATDKTPSPPPARGAADGKKTPARQALARSSRAAAARVALQDNQALPRDSQRPEEKKRRAWYKTWWFWTAVGVGVAVVAGATVGGVLASRDQGTELPSGSLGTLDRR